MRSLVNLLMIYVIVINLLMIYVIVVNLLMIYVIVIETNFKTEKSIKNIFYKENGWSNKICFSFQKNMCAAWFYEKNPPPEKSSPQTLNLTLSLTKP